MLHLYWFNICSNLVRKMSFYIGAATVIVFTLLMIPTSHNYHLFAFFKVSSSFSINRYKSQCIFFVKVAAAFGMLPLFQSPLNILCEISNIDKRGFVICVACIAWAVGQVLFPLVGMISHNLLDLMVRFY